jgi:hypothetical protein
MGKLFLLKGVRGRLPEAESLSTSFVMSRQRPLDREEAWRGRLLPYYRELGIDPEIPVPVRHFDVIARLSS